MFVQTSSSLPAFLVGLLTLALQAACGPASSAPREPAEVQLATPVASRAEHAPRLLVAVAPDEPSEWVTERSRAVSEVPCDAARRSSSIHSATSLHLDFVNRTAGTISLHWIDFSGRLVHYADIPSGETHPQQTYVTHPWIALDRDGRCRGVFVPNGPGTHTVVIGAD